MGQSILIIGIIIYFIKEQYSFSEVKKLNFLFIPIFSLYQFLTQMVWSINNTIALVVILVISVGVGLYQARKTRIRVEEKPIYYMKNDKQEEVPIYKKIVTSVGGSYYLLGWLFIFVAQMLVEVILFHQHLTLEGTTKELFDEIVEDVFSLYRIFNAHKSGWYVWALYGFSSSSYTLFLSHYSDHFKHKVFGPKEKNPYIVEKEKI